MSEFESSREHLWKTIHCLLAKKHLLAAREAQRLLRGWMEEHPNDVYSKEAGETVAMTVEAGDIIEGETAVSRPEEFYSQRAHLWETIYLLLGQADLTTTRQAGQMLQEWMQQHPDDFYSREAGKVIASLEEALTIPQAEKSSELIAA